MTPRFEEADLDAELVFDRYLGTGGSLDVLQEALVELAPRWAAKLRVWRGPKDQRPIDTGQPGTLNAAIMLAVSERGPRYGPSLSSTASHRSNGSRVQWSCVAAGRSSRSSCPWTP